MFVKRKLLSEKF